MKTKQVVFSKELVATLQENDIPGGLAADEIRVRTAYSLVSAGTELAIYRGTESWAPLPYAPGYAAVGEVVEAGDAVGGLKPGDMVFCYGKHAEYLKVSCRDVVVKLPAGVDLREAVFARIAAVSITALRVSPPELGDTVAVVGMGLVGNLAAQLFGLAGARTVGVDLCGARLDLARACGVGRAVDPAAEDPREAVLALTGGRGAETVVEATGVPAAVERAFSMAAPLGDVVLLGSPRGKHEGDITGLLNKVHLWGNGCVSLKGAHEWRYPVKPSAGCKHSLQRNCEIILGLIADGKLRVEPLISRVESPANCQDVYQGLLNHKDKYAGVLFDWTNK